MVKVQIYSLFLKCIFKILFICIAQPSPAYTSLVLEKTRPTVSSVQSRGHLCQRTLTGKNTHFVSFPAETLASFGAPQSSFALPPFLLLEVNLHLLKLDLISFDSFDGLFISVFCTRFILVYVSFVVACVRTITSEHAEDFLELQFNI